MRCRAFTAAINSKQVSGNWKPSCSRTGTMSTERSRSQTPQRAVMGNPGLRANAVTNSLTHWSHLSRIMNFPQLNPVSCFCRDMLPWKKTLVVNTLHSHFKY